MRGGPGASAPVGNETGGHPPAGGPLAFTFGCWFTWTAVGVGFPVLGLFLVAAAAPLARSGFETGDRDEQAAEEHQVRRIAMAAHPEHQARS
ncbi:MAG TPA: hypothetical protein VJT32_11590 [bacterium]|nr:hypothetical protein [bacterium]